MAMNQQLGVHFEHQGERHVLSIRRHPAGMHERLVVTDLEGLQLREVFSGDWAGCWDREGVECYLSNNAKVYWLTLATGGLRTSSSARYRRLPLDPPHPLLPSGYRCR